MYKSFPFQVMAEDFKSLGPFLRDKKSFKIENVIQSFSVKTSFAETSSRRMKAWQVFDLLISVTPWRSFSFSLATNISKSDIKTFEEGGDAYCPVGDIEFKKCQRPHDSTISGVSEK